jgi:hypothetical protein
MPSGQPFKEALGDIAEIRYLVDFDNTDAKTFWAVRMLCSRKILAGTSAGGIAA